MFIEFMGFKWFRGLGVISKKLKVDTANSLSTDQPINLSTYQPINLSTFP